MSSISPDDALFSCCIVSSLSHHYGKSLRRKQESFKYSVKAADQYVFAAAYGEALLYAKKALEIITKKDDTDKLEYLGLTENEFKKIVKVVNCALRDMASGSMQEASRKFMFRSLRQKVKDEVYQGFLDLELELEVSMRNFVVEDKIISRRSISVKKKKGDEDSSRRYGPDGENINEWQPSYAEARSINPVVKAGSSCMIS